MLDRDVFLKPPTEGGLKKGLVETTVKHCLHGLNDAARQFHLSVSECLLEAGYTKLKLDSAQFIFSENGVLHGLVACHVVRFFCRD